MFGWEQETDKLDTDVLDRDKLNVCMYDDVRVHVPYLYMLVTGELGMNELDRPGQARLGQAGHR